MTVVRDSMFQEVIQLEDRKVQPTSNMTVVLIRGEPPGMPEQRKGHAGHRKEAICKPRSEALGGT